MHLGIFTTLYGNRVLVILDQSRLRFQKDELCLNEQFYLSPTQTFCVSKYFCFTSSGI